MRKSIATVSVSGTLPEKLRAVAAAGFDGFELFEHDLVACPLSPSDIRLMAADLGLRVELYQPFRDVEALPPERFADALRRADHKFRLMTRLGADLLLVCSNVSPQAIDDDALAAEQLHTLADRAAAHGVRIAYEALAWGRHVDDYLRSWRIVRMAGHPALGVCLDSFHILSKGTDPVGIEAIPGNKIFFIQLADAPRLTMDTLQWSRHYRCFPGQGDFDLTGFTHHVMAAGYRGPLSLEVFNDVFRRSDPTRTATDAMLSLRFLEHGVLADGGMLGGGILGGDPADGDPADADLRGRNLGGRRLGDGDLSGSDVGGGNRGGGNRDRGKLRDGDLRAGEPGAGDLGGGGIRSRGRGGDLGGGAPPDLTDFAYVELAAGPDGDRLRRLVEVLGFDRVRLVEGGEAAELRAIGIGTPDPAAADAHVAALSAPAHAPDGTRVVFCAPTPGESVIDHVALTAPFAEASLWCRCVLGLRPHESLELPDPYGLVRSRAMTSTNGKVMLALNMADTTSNVPWQHVAVACDDVVGMARRLTAAGEPPLRIPANYYDDLDARFPGAPDLRGTDVLYDRAGDGEFLHLYTATIGRVFFEVVQRIGGYSGYGAANTPVRLAAQHGHKMRRE
ncbi:sugar phosphate isomerase/epimerase and 4-hydroxyphenylpyruvate domain-containing protein [Herbidospora daliensis]|uniref:sugar phosphate isomerase/epimerase and 4-hydroxyphenylpyruvate domain-containing protein n=1 Tax=Herbidospora daliensis TaxID=295585 RepID=UPI00078625D5|nr:sugar phosphate isomerase/epimerase and 4-hydroxyphenylpyruvate domain-containing protein [Herbidospora daliensis]